MIGHGETEGRFTEINGLEIAREALSSADHRPVLQGHINGVVTGADVAHSASRLTVTTTQTMWKSSPTPEAGVRRTGPAGTMRRSQGPWARPVWEWHKAQ